ncbi:hypothetical protein [Ruegeria denitrificans]|uniref:hypothetical protein n=1 Tax=Ruegeria denitrificans TaxID=1715692 RepID=UPI003C7D7546
MPVLLLLLATGVFAYFLWRSHHSGLTRDCRWRQDKSHGIWRCSFCGAEITALDQPLRCLRARDP